MIRVFKRGQSRTKGATRSGRSRKSGRGQSLVEFAIVFPVFMLVLSGILDFGFMLYSRMTVINGAREGARAAIIATDKTTIPALAHQAIGNSVAGTGLNTSNIGDSESCKAAVAGNSCDFVSGNGTTDAAQGDSVSVTVTYVYRSFFPLLFGTTFNVSSTVQMVIE